MPAEAAVRQYTAGNDIEVIMDQARKNSIYRKIFLIAVIAAAAALTAVRVHFADQVGAWYPADQDFDDALLVRYADFRDHSDDHNGRPDRRDH